MHDDVREFFDKLADSWDGRVSHPAERIGYVLESVGNIEGSSVLDVGCGTGVMAEPLLKLAGKGGSVTAIDIAPNMVAEARRKYSAPNLEFVAADFLAWDTPDLFDLVVAYSCYPHFPVPDDFWKAAARRLSPGGRVLVAHIEGREKIDSLHVKRAPGVSRRLESVEEAALSVERAGLEVLASEDTEGYFIVLAGRNQPISGVR